MSAAPSALPPAGRPRSTARVDLRVHVRRPATYDRAPPATPSPRRCWPTASPVATQHPLGRPRGIIAAGREEPNALVQVERAVPGADAARPPRSSCTTGWWPRACRTGPAGRPSPTPPLRREVRRTPTCSWSAPARPGSRPRCAAARTGARVILARRPARARRRPARHAAEPIDGGPAPGVGGRGTWPSWPTRRRGRACCTRTTAFGVYDDNYVLALQRRTDHLGAAARRRTCPAQRIWHIRARQVVLATGAHERRWSSRTTTAPASCSPRRAHLPQPLRRRCPAAAVVFTTNDSAYAAAADLARAGVEVAAVVDARPAPAPGPASAPRRGIEVLHRQRRDRHARERRASPASPSPQLGTTAARRPAPSDRLRPAARLRRLDPVVHLHSQAPGPAALRRRTRRVRARRRPSTATGRSPAPAAATFDPGRLPRRRRRRRRRRGLAAGRTSDVRTRSAVTGERGGLGPDPPAVAGARPGRHAGRGSTTSSTSSATRRSPTSCAPPAPACARSSTSSATPRSAPPTTRARPPASTPSASSPHALGVRASRDIGTTTYRAPYTPVAFAALAGRERGELFDPERVTSHPPLARGARRAVRGRRPVEAAVVLPAGRARTWTPPCCANARAVREAVGDDGRHHPGQDRDPGRRTRASSSTGIYTNAVKKLKVGAARYGVMCRRRRHGLRRRR